MPLRFTDLPLRANNQISRQVSSDRQSCICRVAHVVVVIDSGYYGDSDISATSTGAQYGYTLHVAQLLVANCSAE